MKTIIVEAEVMFMGYRAHCTTMEDARAQARKLADMGAKDITIDGVPFENN